jgi:hypothetical protein
MPHCELIIKRHVTIWLMHQLTMKYLNGPLGGWIGPHMSPCMLSRKARDSCPTFAGDGCTINFPWQHAVHEKSFDWRTLWFFNVCPDELLIIFGIITLRGWTNRSCQIINCYGWWTSVPPPYMIHSYWDLYNTNQKAILVIFPTHTFSPIIFL